MTETWDAVVVGAGPSGCAAATELARRGRRVLVLERDEKPRFKIGESLLPWNMPIFERLGVLPKILAAGFQPKYGAFFWNETTGGTRAVVFKDALEHGRPFAFQVERVKFDPLLLDHAAASGAAVRRGVRAEAPIVEGGRTVGVLVSAAGGAEEVRARVVVDATGQAALIASQLKIRRGDPRLRRAALYAHYTGVWRAEGDTAGDILLPFLRDVWYWVIPFASGSASVGAVVEPALLKELPGSREEQLGALLARSPKMREFLAHGRRTTDVMGSSDYSISADRLAGDGWVLAGDAGTFIDPVFSTGVYLGMSAGVRAAEVIDRELARKGRVDGRDFAAYERTTRRMVARFRPFVYGYYDPFFTREFCEQAPFRILERAVTSTLAGNVERPSLTTRLLNGVVLGAFGFMKSRQVRRVPRAARSAA